MGVAGGWGYGLIAVRIQPPVRLEHHLTEDQEPLNGGPNFFRFDCLLSDDRGASCKTLAL